MWPCPLRSKDAVVAPSLSRSLYSPRELVVFPFVTIFFFYDSFFPPCFLFISVMFLVPWPFALGARRRLLPSALLSEDAGRREEGALRV